MAVIDELDLAASKLPLYRAWVEAWLTTEPTTLPVEECLTIIQTKGIDLLQDLAIPTTEFACRLNAVVACFKTAAKARAVLLGGKTTPSCDGCDVLSGSYDARVKCACSGLFPVPENLAARELKACGCKAIERMMGEAELVNGKEDEWNSSEFFSAKQLSSAVTELALCHADIQAVPSSCCGVQGTASWPEVQAPDRKPDPNIDLDDKLYNSLYPTHEHIRLSADAKHFFAVASGGALVDVGIQMAIADSGNDILIGDYCDAATEERLEALQKIGAAAFAFLKLCVYAELMTKWQFDHLVAQVIQFRVISFWRDHSLSHRPKGVYGSRMTGMDVHRHIDLGMVVGIVSASMATGQTMSAEGYKDLVNASVLINDLIDFRGDTWRNQRENVVLRGVRGSLCIYLDDLLIRCLRDAGSMIRRGKIFALMVMCFCNWMLLSSGHKIYETLHGVRPIAGDEACHYKSTDNGAYETLLEALEPYGSMGKDGPSIEMTRKELQLLYAKYRRSPEDHSKWTADMTRIVLHPDNMRKLVDVVHYQWTGALGNVNYCA